MALDELRIIVDVVDSFSEELDEAMADLGALEGVAEAVDDITIDVDVIGDQQISRLQAQLMALNAQVAQMRMSGVTAGVGAAGGGLSEADRMADSFDPLNLRMEDLHNALAKLMPLILTYIGALPAAITGVVALGAAAVSAAAGLAALGGLAAAGAFMQEGFTLQDLIDRLRTDFQDAFGPLMEDLTPLFYDALDGFEALMDAIAARGDILKGLSDDARAFGGFILDWVPDVMAAMGRMADAWGPLMGRIANALQGMSILRGLTEFMSRAAPAFLAFGNALLNIIPKIVEISIGFMEAAAGITALISQALNFITAGGKLSEIIGAGAAALLSFYSAIVLANAAGKVFAATYIQDAILALMTYIPSITAATVATNAFFKVLAAGLAMTGIGAVLIGIGAAVGFISDRFISASSDIDKATQSLREFKSVSDSFGGAGSDFYGVDTNLQRRTATMGAGGGVTINVEGGADEDDVRKQLHNGLYRAHRTQQ